MRLIDADEIKAMWYEINNITEEDRGARFVGYQEIGRLIDNAPTVDAVEVVRCKDCKWWDKDDNYSYGYCMAMKHGYMSANWEIGIYRKYKGDFYCADGERAERREDGEA